MSDLPALEAEFRATGRFMDRRGPAYLPDGPYCNKKLCLVATDKAYLVRLLLALSCDEARCFYVKYSAAPRDGMYLGRVFLTSEDAAGELWARYKQDPKLMCSIQDDDFTKPFREKYDV
jgi:hypothetical protein